MKIKFFQNLNIFILCNFLVRILQYLKKISNPPIFRPFCGPVLSMTTFMSAPGQHCTVSLKSECALPACTECRVVNFLPPTPLTSVPKVIFLKAAEFSG